MNQSDIISFEEVNNKNSENLIFGDGVDLLKEKIIEIKGLV